ncbi:MAG TPA: methyltransferase domain-containing protein [Kofleriaceae bacterium]|nr:methyltransferase domain-containing protein [Kofleriaceae bacterium]
MADGPQLDRARLRTAVDALYSRLVAEPDGSFHFNRGLEYAVVRLAYDRDELQSLPERAVRSFAGAGNPHAIDALAPGETVVDVGCGTGTDLLLAARHVGPTGRAIGIDGTEQMIEGCRASIAASGLTNVEVRRGDADALPVDDESVDVVMSNGVLNLTPDKDAALREIHRILRPGGRLLLADIVVAMPVPSGMRDNVDLWAC